MLRYLVVILTLSGCGATRAYHGPARPQGEVSTITIRSSGETTIQSLRLDGELVSSFNNTYEVLPGAHTFRVEIRLEYPKSCPQGDFYCNKVIVYGHCDGNVTTKPGKDYLATINTDGLQVTGTVLAKGYFDFSEREDEPNIGSLSCYADKNYFW